MNIEKLIEKSRAREPFSREEIVAMLSFPSVSEQTMRLMAEGSRISRELTDNEAEVQGQFALNLAPCPINCQFCSFSSEYEIFREQTQISVKQAVESAKLFDSNRENAAVLMMATADYSFGRLLETAQEVRRALDPSTLLIANVGDMSLENAKRMKESGFHGVYHAVRIGEGSRTRAPKKQRLRSIRNFQEAGLVVGTCVEPIGPEHFNEEIAEHIMLAGSFDPAFSGAARRITIPGSKLETHGMISELRMSQIVAVTRIATPRSVTGNCSHEPCSLAAAAGASLFWAETGANPRDIKEKTEEGRGLSVQGCADLFREADWQIRTQPSLYFSKTHQRLADPDLPLQV
ncbi:MAG: radical SAM protein [Thermodesulfobacteriota bacterium]|nr:radical SAM protein [Thermodesulfobacteriota bacterium]